MTLSLYRSSMLSLLMILSSFLPVLLAPTKQLSKQVEKIDLEQAVPKSFGKWRIDPSIAPIQPSAETAENLNKTYDQILSRTYVNDSGQRIMLSVAYGGSQNRELRAHRQEVCYAAQGFNITQLHGVDLSLNGVAVQATRMVAQQGERIEPVTYWFTMGDEVVRNLVERQLVDLKYTLSGIIPDGYLFRVSSLLADAETAFADQRKFAAELLAHTDRRLVNRLLGEKY